MLDVKAFLEMPYLKQVHICALEWLHNQRLPAFRTGKPVPEYYRCRADLLKLERQTVNNIALMLADTTDQVPLWHLAERAAVFVRQRQLQAEMSKVSARKEYKIDVNAFLGR